MQPEATPMQSCRTTRDPIESLGTVVRLPSIHNSYACALSECPICPPGHAMNHLITIHKVTVRISGQYPTLDCPEIRTVILVVVSDMYVHMSVPQIDKNTDYSKNAAIKTLKRGI